MKTIIQIKTLNLYLNENNYSTKKIKLYLKESIFIKSPPPLARNVSVQGGKPNKDLDWYEWSESREL